MIFMFVISGCSEFSSKPARVDAAFGDAVHEMKILQTINPSKRLNNQPILVHDGNKMQQIFNTTYRGDILSPQPVEASVDKKSSK